MPVNVTVSLPLEQSGRVFGVVNVSVTPVLPIG
jgi:hypothetical protein